MDKYIRIGGLRIRVRGNLGNLSVDISYADLTLELWRVRYPTGVSEAGAKYSNERGWE